MLSAWARKLSPGAQIPFKGGGHLPVLGIACAALTGCAIVVFAIEHSTVERKLTGTHHNHSWERYNASYNKFQNHEPIAYFAKYGKLYDNYSFNRK